MTSIDKIVILVDETDEREFIVTIGGREVRVSADALMSQNKFAMEVLKQTDRLWHRVKSADFASMVDGALEKAERVTMPLKGHVPCDGVGAPFLGEARSLFRTPRLTA